MTALYIILGVLFLIFLPIINIYFPFVGSYISDSMNKDYDLNPNKRKARESEKAYNERLKINRVNVKVQSPCKNFIKTFFTVLLLITILAIFICSL